MQHALIIGAGPAGSLAAILLARAGWQVMIVEQSRFPRDKVCGECVSALGIAVLTRANLIAPLRRRGTVNLTRALLHAPTGECCDIQLPSLMLGISRSMLDDFLLTEAGVAGATLVQPARCESLQSTTTGVTATIRSQQSTSTITADIALLADGKGKLLPHAPPPTGDFGIKAHFTGIDAPPNAIELFGVNGHYGGLSSVEGDRWNSSFAVPAERLRDCRGDLDRLFATIVSENRALTTRFAHARRVSDWYTSPLPRFAVSRDWPPNIIPLGNAAAAIEPIGGEGIGLALRSAEWAVQAILTGPLQIADLRRKFRSLWMPRRLACRVSAKIISSPTWSKRLLRFGEFENPLIPLLLHRIGKASNV